MIDPEVMSLPELVETLHRVADEIEARMMQRAGEPERCIVCGAVIPEGRQICPKCEVG